PAHARWPFGPTTAPEPDATSDNFLRRALINISRLEDGNRGGLVRTLGVKAVDLGSRRVIQVPSTSVTTGPWSIGRSENGRRLWQLQAFVEQVDDVGNRLRSGEKESLHGLAAEFAENLELFHFFDALRHSVKMKVGRQLQRAPSEVRRRLVAGQISHERP